MAHSATHKAFNQFILKLLRLDDLDLGQRNLSLSGKAMAAIRLADFGGGCVGTACLPMPRPNEVPGSAPPDRAPQEVLGRFDE